ncbi:sulfotransferase family protein [Marinimicrobium koreense]|uniref:Sulfotransferase family protein n=1 Tax=Marinimicrobium koreense TaxID=306545 RepID=A0A3N1NZQ9_9GAMM|nr:sulfotransferase [Marinimicrobium koreense]ROQ18156.1 sulfotransferase family protein [Marinimicrobium koreense]
MHLMMAWMRLGGHLLRALPANGWRACWWRWPLLLLLWLGSGLLFLCHALGFLLDELLFRGYRRVAVRAPVFIVGVPRSGTTFLQRHLADDPAFTTLTLWECLLAPSISERYFWRFVGWCLAPLRRWIGRWRWAAMDRVHRLAWQEPEEDFLLLLYRGGCFLPALLCPGAERYWRLAFFDDAVPAPERRAMLAFYRRCLQRHLYFHGRDKRLLSKNPSFTPWIQDLRAAFPDARFIACVRRPEEAVPSQLSALRPVLRLWGGDSVAPELSERMITVLHGYYRRVLALRGAPWVQVLPLAELSRLDTRGWFRLYAFLGQPLPSGGAVALSDESRRDAGPGHRYDLAEFGLSEAGIRQRFVSVWPHP